MRIFTSTPESRIVEGVDVSLAPTDEATWRPRRSRTPRLGGQRASGRRGRATQNSGVVVALRFDEPLAAQELAVFCGGEVVLRLDAPSERERAVILVPTRRGARPAHVMDWIVRRGPGDFYPCTPEEFAFQHTPHDEPNR